MRRLGRSLRIVIGVLVGGVLACLLGAAALRIGSDAYYLHKFRQLSARGRLLPVDTLLADYAFTLIWLATECRYRRLAGSTLPQ